ncbi:MAG: AAA family ATPase, partial [Catenulispora sp.]
MTDDTKQFTTCHPPIGGSPFSPADDDILGRLRGLREDAVLGIPAIAFVSGAAGMGKTFLLRAYEVHAATEGAAVLRAACTAAERHEPYSTIRRIFSGIDSVRLPTQPFPMGTPESKRELHRTAQGLFQSISRLAERNTLVVSIDDIQYADIHSLHCLRYLVHRITQVPLAFIYTADWPCDRILPPIFAELMHHLAMRRVHLEPLSRDAVVQLIRKRIGDAAAGRLADLHRAQTGGNPLLVEALLRGEFRHALLDCVRRSGNLAVRVARSIAVLGEPADISLLSRLSRLSSQTTTRVVERLTELGVLDDLRFRHSAAATAILDDTPRWETVHLRHRAAFLLHQDGRPADAVAEQLLAAGPLCQDWVRAVLEDGATQALANNQVTRSMRYLQLLSECCPDLAHDAGALMAVVGWLRAPAQSTPRLRTLKQPVLQGKVKRGLSQ